MREITIIRLNSKLKTCVKTSNKSILHIVARLNDWHSILYTIYPTDKKISLPQGGRGRCMVNYASSSTQSFKKQVLKVVG